MLFKNWKSGAIQAQQEECGHCTFTWTLIEFSQHLWKNCFMIVHGYKVHQPEVEKKGLYSENRLIEITESTEHFFIFHPRKYKLSYHISCDVRVIGDVSVYRETSRIAHHSATECHQGKLCPIHRPIPKRWSAHRFFLTFVWTGKTFLLKIALRSQIWDNESKPNTSSFNKLSYWLQL